eukprot:767102-Hanusia_phi.AAC.8
MQIEKWQGEQGGSGERREPGGIEGGEEHGCYQSEVVFRKQHVWRAFLESVCYGTRACIDGLSSAGIEFRLLHEVGEKLLKGRQGDQDGGRSDEERLVASNACGRDGAACGLFRILKFIGLLYLTNVLQVVGECSDGPLLGCAILSAVATAEGYHDGRVEKAVAEMVRNKKVIHPNMAKHLEYDKVYKTTYKPLAPAIRTMKEARSLEAVKPPRAVQHFKICPSLLACDWADIAGALKACEEGGEEWIHLGLESPPPPPVIHFLPDMFDGVQLNDPDALTFGPQMVKAIRRFGSSSLFARASPWGRKTNLKLDVHLIVDRPSRYVEALAKVTTPRSSRPDRMFAPQGWRRPSDPSAGKFWFRRRGT